jgi:uncharacterized membrane protein (DUF106 family)
MVFENLLNPVFGPLVNLPPLVSIFVIALIVSLIVTFVYKYMTDQAMMKDLKMRQKEMQKKMKAAKGDPQKAMRLQKEAMSVNMQYMKQSFKPTLITFLPIIIIFGWLNANLAFMPLVPGEEFSATLVFEPGTTGDVSVSVPDGVYPVDVSTQSVEGDYVQFRFAADEGDYLLVFEHDGVSYDKELTITNEQRYAPVTKVFKGKPLKSISLSNRKQVPIPITDNHLGWLGTYILFSIFLSMGLRKIMKIY